MPSFDLATARELKTRVAGGQWSSGAGCNGVKVLYRVSGELLEGKEKGP